MTLTVSQDDWLRVRSYLREHRHALAVDAAGDYPAERRLVGTRCSPPRNGDWPSRSRCPISS